MNKKTLKALEESIVKWENILLGTGVDDGEDNCTLCKLFFGDYCDGCVVSKETGKIECSETPYRKWMEHQEKCHEDKDVVGWDASEIECRWCRHYAEQELEFLRSLLPK